MATIDVSLKCPKNMSITTRSDFWSLEARDLKLEESKADVKKKTTFDSQIIVPQKTWKTGENQLHIKISSTQIIRHR